jgi:hypothetical protein
MPDSDHTSPLPADPSDSVSQAELEQVLEIVPRGALALAGTALGLTMLAYLLVYFLVFLPRGAVS